MWVLGNFLRAFINPVTIAQWVILYLIEKYRVLLFLVKGSYL